MLYWEGDKWYGFSVLRATNVSHAATYLYCCLPGARRLPIGSDAVAALGIAQKISMVPMYIAMGVSHGLQPLVGYNYSSGNYHRMKDAILSEAVVSYGSRFLQCLCLARIFRQLSAKPGMVD